MTALSDFLATKIERALRVYEHDGRPSNLTTNELRLVHASIEILLALGFIKDPSCQLPASSHWLLAIDPPTFSSPKPSQAPSQEQPTSENKDETN